MRSSEKIAGTENLVYTLNSPGFGIPAYKFQGAAALCCELLNTRLIRLRGYSVQSEGLLPSIWNTESIAVWIAFVVFENTFSLSHLHILRWPRRDYTNPHPKRGVVGCCERSYTHMHYLQTQKYKHTKILKHKLCTCAVFLAYCKLLQDWLYFLHTLRCDLVCIDAGNVRPRACDTGI